VGVDGGCAPNAGTVTSRPTNVPSSALGGREAAAALPRVGYSPQPVGLGRAARSHGAERRRQPAVFSKTT
jgi:hypothetical protein